MRPSPVAPPNQAERPIAGCGPRPNRGGDRQLNWALHVITLQRVRHHAETAAYYQRLLDAGKTTKEAKRCVKPALAATPTTNYGTPEHPS
jgi:hypothetical protein